MGYLRPVIVSRVLALLIIMGLALPSAMATRPVAATDASIQAVREAPVNAFADQASAKAKKKGKKNKKNKKDTPPPPVQQFTTVTRIVRQPVTKTFSNTGHVSIPASGTTGIASPYPSLLEVDGFVNGVITDVNLTLNGFGHAHPDDVDILLAATHLAGQNAKVMSDAGEAPDVFGLALTLDDQAATSLPDNPASAMVSGTFKPSDYSLLDDTFPAPAPAPSGNVPLSVFNNKNPNGTWQLFVNDDSQLDIGSITGGWSLEITAEADVEVQEQVAVQTPPDPLDPPKEKKDKKKKGGKKGRN